VCENESFLHAPARGPVKLIRELIDTLPADVFTTILGYGRRRRLWA
jgi:hypothetical protein